MDTQNMLWQEEGVNLYTKYSDDQIDKTLPKYLDEAFKFMLCTIETQHPFVVMDYGTADGRNFITVLPRILEKARLKYGPKREVSAILNDVLDNDYKSVWMNASGLTDEQDIEGLYFSTVAKSFHNQCVPSSSVHLAVASSATHWIEKRDLSIKETCCTNLISDPDSKEAVRKLSENTWNNFLIRRAKELVPGGVLVLLNIGNDGNEPNVWERLYTRPLDKAWNLLYEKRIITKEEKEAALVPMYVRTREEHKKPFLDPESDVSREGLELVMYKEIWSTNLHRLRDLYKGTITDENAKDVGDVIAEARAWEMKIICFPHFQCALDPNKSAREKENIMQQLFDNIKSSLKADTDLFDFENTLYHHIMVIRKKV